MDDEITEFKSSLPLIKGEFNISTQAFQKKASHIKAFLFDWDGVFNQGEKGGGLHSGFTEPDSMGINMLRFAYWLNNNKEIPYIGIITGENNPVARELGTREHFDTVFSSIGNKTNVISFLKKKYRINTQQIAFTFDDVLDLGLAENVGLKILVHRNASPLFTNYVKNIKICDYISFCQGNEHAVREVSELLCLSFEQFENAIILRSRFDTKYQEYLSMRNKIKTEFITNQEL